MPINYYCDVEVQSNVLTTDISNSRVGINEGSPTATLQVNGNIRTGASSGSTYLNLYDDEIEFFNTGSERATMTLYPNTSSGNLYIYGANGSTIYFGAPASYTTNIDVQGTGRFQTIANASSDTDKFLVSDSGTIKYRTGAEVLADIGAGTGTVTGSGTANQVAIWNTSSELYGDSGMTWNSTSNILTVSGRYTCSSTGSAASPVYYFSGRSTTGMYFNYSPEEIRWSINGTEKLSLSSSTLTMDGDIEVTGNDKVYSSNDEIYLMAGGTSGTNVKVDDSAGEITNNTDTIVNGYVKATATSDAYKGYIKNTINTIVNEKSSTADYNYIPFNSVQTGTTNQYYNAFVAPYNGRVKKIHTRHTGGNTPTATAVRFKKQINGTTSSTVYTATVSSGATTSMQAEYNFGNSDFTFNEGDLLRIAMQTSDAFGTGSKTMGGAAIAIVLEYNIT